MSIDEINKSGIRSDSVILYVSSEKNKSTYPYNPTKEEEELLDDLVGKKCIYIPNKNVDPIFFYASSYSKPTDDMENPPKVLSLFGVNILTNERVWIPLNEAFEGTREFTHAILRLSPHERWMLTQSGKKVKASYDNFEFKVMKDGKEVKPSKENDLHDYLALQDWFEKF